MSRAAAMKRLPMAEPSNAKTRSLAFMMVMMAAMRKKKPAQKKWKIEKMATMARAVMATMMPMLTARVITPKMFRMTSVAAATKSRPQMVRKTILTGRRAFLPCWAQSSHLQLVLHFCGFCMILTPCLERASQDFNILARDVKFLVGVAELDSTGGTDGCCKREDVIDIGNACFADTEEIGGEDSL